jgi:hypothetical protein
MEPLRRFLSQGDVTAPTSGELFCAQQEYLDIG